MTLEARNYVATDKDITDLTSSLIAAADTLQTGRTTYLRTLHATTVDALGARVRVNAAKIAKLDEAGMQAQLAALTQTHERFYALVLKVAGADNPKALELNRRSNFARTAFYALRTWVKAGNDLTSLAPAKVSKSSLLVVGRKIVRPASPQRLKTRAEKQSKALMASILALAESDPASAVAELRLISAQLQEELQRLAAAAPAHKARAHPPVHVKHSDTAVRRHMAQPS